MAPELLSGAPPSPKTDLFALGVVAYQLLTGESFGSGAKMPSELGFPKAWDAPIVGCLYTDPADRWANVAEFQRSLEGLKPLRMQAKTGRKERTRTVQSAAPLAVPLATPAPTASEPRRGGWLPSVVMVLAAVALGGFWWVRERQRVKTPPLAFPEVPADERFFLAPGREGWTLMRVHPDACGVVRVPAAVGGKRLSEVSAEALEGCRHVTELRLPAGVTRLAAKNAASPAAPQSPEAAEALDPIKPLPPPQTAAQVSAPAGAAPSAEDTRPAAGALLEEAGAVWQVRRDRASVELVGTTSEPPEVWILPEQVQGLPVVAIGREALQETERIFERVVLPRALREIEPEAFADCAIEQLELPEGMETIGMRAFYKAKIKQIRFPSTLKTIGYQAFDSALFGSPVELPEGVTRVERDAFARCNFMYHTVVLPSTVKRLPVGTFWKAWDIAKIDLKGVTEVPSEALSQLPDNFKGGDTLDLIFGQQHVTFAPKSLGFRRESIARRAYLRLFFPQGAEVSFAPDFLETPETQVEVHRDSWITHWDNEAKAWAEGPLLQPKKTPKALKPPKPVLPVEATFSDDKGRYTVRQNAKGGCTLISIRPTFRGSNRTVEIPAKDYYFGPITRVAADAMRSLDATMQLRLHQEIYFEPGTFPKGSPRAIAFPGNEWPIFSCNTFAGKIPEFYSFHAEHLENIPPVKVKAFVKDRNAFYLKTARGCLLFQAKSADWETTSFRVPERVQGLEVVGILPDAFATWPNLKTVIPPKRKDFTVYPGAFNGTQCSQ